MLHITNGSSVSLADTGIGGEIVCWADVLHEGPVPAGLDLADLSRLRASFLSGQWPGVPSSLRQRDAALERFAAHDEVTLWFEHDLYDQLQLIQILDWFNGRNIAPTRLSLICIGAFAGVDPFYGLGQLTGGQLATLWPRRREVTAAEIDLAAAAWRAFRSPDPGDIEKLFGLDTSALPFLQAALLRHLEEFPSLERGLGRVQRQILEMLDGGPRALHALYSACWRQEESPYLGDTTFAVHVQSLALCRNPLVAESGGEYRLTQTGRDVLAGRADHVRLNGLNRWLGGVHLQGSDALWRWDPRRRRLVAH